MSTKINTPKPLLLYLKAWNLPRSEFIRLRNAGYCPLAVESFDHIKVVEPVLLHTENAISKAAFIALLNSSYSQPQIDFAKGVARALSQ